MCFDYDCGAPTVFRQTHRRARKTHRCCECRMPILPGEQHEESFGIWEGDPQTFRTCEVCQWFISRVVDAELKAGCRIYEARPAFGALMEAFADGHDEEIGLVDLDCWHEREED